MTDAVVLRQVVDPHDPAIEHFGRMQRAAYFAPETLIPASYIPRMLEAEAEAEADAQPRTAASQRRNFLVVAEHDGQVVGGTLFHWLARAGSGFSSFLGVERGLRRQGIARRLHQARLAILDRAAGDRQPGVFIDVVNPTRLSADELERERQAGSDPWQRRHAFGQLGFRQVDLRYLQPVGGPNGGPVTVLDLLYYPRQPRSSIPTRLVADTMQDYWSPWLGDDAVRYARELEARAGGRPEVALIWPEPPRAPGES